MRPQDNDQQQIALVEPDTGMRERALATSEAGTDARVESGAAAGGVEFGPMTADGRHHPIIAQRSEVPLASIMVPVQNGVGERRVVAPNREEGSGGVKLLLSDTKVTLLMLDEARYRLVLRVFGVDREGSYLVTVIAVVVIAQMLRDKAAEVFTFRPRPSDAIIVHGMVRETVYGIVGDSYRDTPLLGRLVALAVIGGFFRPVLRMSLRDLTVSSVWARAEFYGRYGHLVRRLPRAPFRRGERR